MGEWLIPLMDERSEEYAPRRYPNLRLVVVGLNPYSLSRKGRYQATWDREWPVHRIISMTKWIRTSRLSIQNSLSIQSNLRSMARVATQPPPPRRRSQPLPHMETLMIYKLG